MAESMVGGTICGTGSPPVVIQREISRVLVLHPCGKPGGGCAPPRTTMPLTEISLLSRGTDFIVATGKG